jgi:hypothetical protein
MSRLVRYCGHGFAATFVIAALANCGGGERPPPEKDPLAPTEAPPAGDTITITPLSAEGLVFGENTFVDCGKQAPEKVLTLSNPTNDVVNFKAKLTAGQTFFKLNPEGGGIPIRGKATIQVIPNPIPQTSEVTPDLYAGTLEITTDVKKEVEDPPTVIRLHQTARGAIITSTLAGDVDFGDVKVGTTGVTRFSFTNSGNVDATATFSLGSQIFRIDEGQSATAVLNPGSVVNKLLTAAPPTTGDYNDSLNVTFNTTAVQCKTPPGALKVKGRGTTSVGVSPGTLIFGNVNCGTAAPFQTIVISSTVQMAFTPNLAKGSGSPYTLADSTGNPLVLSSPVAMAAGANYTMRIVPKVIPKPASIAANAFGDTLSITTDVQNDVVHNVVLTQTAQGAIFKFTPVTKIERLAEPINNVTTNDFTIENSGNAAAPFSLSIVPLTSLPLTPGMLALVNAGPFGGGTTTATLTIQAPGAYDTPGWGAIRLDPGNGAVLCADPPSDMPVSVKTKPAAPPP